MPVMPGSSWREPNLIMELHRDHRHRLVREHKKGEAVVQAVSNYGDGGIPG